MAIVYLAEDLRNHRPVAIKVLRPELATALGPERFRREIETVTRLSHPNILPLYESGQAGGELFYVMPFVEGESLRGRLNREKQLPLEDALQITLEVADALSYAHSRGIVHRDIKPDNILFQAGHAVVSDFGIARVVTSAGVETLTATGLAVGTPTYMSPEQASGDRNVDARCDQYSLGCVLYEMLAGDPPYTASSAQALIARKLSDPLPRISVVRDRVPAHVQAALERALARVPADRYRTMAEFAFALRSAQAAAPVRPSLPTTAAALAATPATRARLVRAGAIVAGLAVVVWLIRTLFHPTTFTKYPDHSAWSPWGGWVGENIPVVAVADSQLLVQGLGSREVVAFNGATWKSESLPESFDLLPFTGSAPGGRLLAIRFAGVPDQSRGQLVWMSASTGATQPLHETPDGLPLGSRPSWWSDGRDVVTWYNQIWRSNSSGWIDEAVGPRGFISEMWGRDLNHRFAISLAQQDSVLAFDGISWAATDISGSKGDAVHLYVAGATFPDSTTVVVGSECLEHERCRPTVVQQDGFAAPWRAVPLPTDVGLPLHFPSDSTRCEPEGGRFNLVGVAGRSRNDFVLWGSWTPCNPAGRQELSGCPPRQPCAWQAREGRLSPVEEMVGRIVLKVVYIDTVAYALADDGSLWRRIGERWRVVTRVPTLPVRLVEASPYVVVRATGADIRYEPGFADTLSEFFAAPLPSESGPSTRPKQLVVRDSSAALLMDNGRILVSRCGRVRGRSGYDPGVPETPTGSPALVLRCSKRSALSLPPSSSRIVAISILPGGEVLGVGPGLAATWLNGRFTREPLPPAAQNDEFWSVVTTLDGSAMAIGTTTIVRRNRGARWQLVRRVSEAHGEANRFAVLPNGDLVVAGITTIHVWGRASTDTLPSAILYSTQPGETLGPVRVLSDGRLVAGLANPGQPLTGGRLLVWGSPTQANRLQAMELPITVNITSLSSDGRRLYVAGPGGTLSIPIDSLPFSRGAQN